MQPSNPRSLFGKPGNHLIRAGQKDHQGKSGSCPTCISGPLISETSAFTPTMHFHASGVSQLGSLYLRWTGPFAHCSDIDFNRDSSVPLSKLCLCRGTPEEHHSECPGWEHSIPTCVQQSCNGYFPNSKAPPWPTVHSVPLEGKVEHFVEV